MKYVYLDTEFNRKDFTKRGLVSLALVTDDSSYYAVNADMNIHGIASDGEVGEWMTENVLKPHIPTFGGVSSLRHDHPDVKGFSTIGREVDAFLMNACPSGVADRDIEMIVKCGSQDMVRMHGVLTNHDWGLFGEWIPTYADDMARIQRRAYDRGVRPEDLPVQREGNEHHALHDAEHEREVHQYILSRLGPL